MICATCNGEVVWKGPFFKPTHTGCMNCGARNNHVWPTHIDENECLPDGWDSVHGSRPGPIIIQWRNDQYTIQNALAGLQSNKGFCGDSVMAANAYSLNLGLSQVSHSKAMSRRAWVPP